jgi:hypothetical protein
MFNGPKLKIERAEQHIEELNRILTTFIKTDFCRFHVDKQQNTGHNLIKFEIIKPFPCEIPLVIGDAIHNLRSALDLMACEIVSMAGGRPSRYTNFPFRETKQELEAAINGGEIKIAGPDIVTVLLDNIKPYNNGGNNTLCALHSLDVIDKHRLLIPTISIAALTHVNAKIGPMILTDCTLVVGQGGVLNLASIPGNIEIEGQGQPAYAILFDKGQVFEGQAVVPTLLQLKQLVSGVVQTIEKAYLARAEFQGHNT